MRHLKSSFLRTCCTLRLTLWLTEVSEGWQGEGGMGDEVDALDITGLAGVDTAQAS